MKKNKANFFTKLKKKSNTSTNQPRKHKNNINKYLRYNPHNVTRYNVAVYTNTVSIYRIYGRERMENY